MEIRLDRIDGGFEVHISGELDHHAAGKASAELRRLVDSELPRRLVINMGKLRFMDSSGIALLLKARKLMNEIDGTVEICELSGQPLRVFEAAGIGKIMDIQFAGR